MFVDTQLNNVPPKETTNVITYPCGCKERTTTKNYYSHTETITKSIHICPEHAAINAKKKAKQIILTDKQAALYNRLDIIIDEIQDCGVDVSYFPEEARNVLKKWAINWDNPPPPNGSRLYHNFESTPIIYNPPADE